MTEDEKISCSSCCISTDRVKLAVISDLLPILSSLFAGNSENFEKSADELIAKLVPSTEVSSVENFASENALASGLNELQKAGRQLNNAGEIAALKCKVDVDLVAIQNELQLVTNPVADKYDSLNSKVKALEAELVSSAERYASDLKALRAKNEELANNNDKLFEELDNLQQYGRRETVVIHNVPMDPNEKCIDVVCDFLRGRMGINFRRDEISTTHRLWFPGCNEKCPPIYVKFLPRDLKHHVMKKRRNLSGQCNRFGERFFIVESLTPFRRELLEYTKKQLHDWKFIWTMNGNIMARKDRGDKLVRIRNYKVVDDLARFARK